MARFVPLTIGQQYADHFAPEGKLTLWPESGGRPKICVSCKAENERSETVNAYECPIASLRCKRDNIDHRRGRRADFGKVMLEASPERPFVIEQLSCNDFGYSELFVGLHAK
jgi:hypothetical protein